MSSDHGTSSGHTEGRQAMPRRRLAGSGAHPIMSDRCCWVTIRTRCAEGRATPTNRSYPAHERASHFEMIWNSISFLFLLQTRLVHIRTPHWLFSDYC
jgi:hypothetical protein